MASHVHSERRREDERLITGTGHYVDDIRLPAGRPAALHLAVVRSIYAHAEINSINLEAARALPGVVAAFAGEELVRDMPTIAAVPVPGLKMPQRRPLAVGRARYVGDPLAVVLAESRAIAADALDLVEVDYTPLPSVADPEAAMQADAPLLYPEFGSNVAMRAQPSGGDVEAAFAQAAHTVRLRLVNQRLAPASLEPRACLFDFDPASGQLSAWLSSQAVYRAREMLATFLGIDRARIHVQNAEVGGGFGSKTNFPGEEVIAAALAVRLGRPVKWLESRSENLQTQTQGRGQINEVEAAFQSDGRLLGLKVKTIADLGAFLFGISAMIASGGTTSLLSGAYTLGAFEHQVVGVFTNKVPTAPYRGAGRPEAAYIIERVMDAIAQELQLDPVEVRRRNFIAPDAFPYRSVTGLNYDSGNYPTLLEEALQLGDYQGWRAKQRERRAQAGQGVAPVSSPAGAGSLPLLGIGLATFVETTGGSFPGPVQEAATVRIRADGSILVQSGVSTTGQGHVTTFARIAAQVFGLPEERVEVRLNDSALPAYSFGTFGSRVAQIGGSAVFLAAQTAREKAVQVAAHVLEAAPADLLLADGQVQVRGAPSRAVTLGDLARRVEEQPELMEHDAPNPVNGAPIEGLAAWRDFAPSGQTISAGAHIAVVEVDAETGEVRVLQYVAVDDCGRVLHHTLAEGQIHGGLAQGIGQALYEEARYDDNGQPLSGTLLDYALPTAQQLPTFTTGLLETPSPLNPLGAKGVGEAGTIGAPPAIVNAALDALAPLGVKSLDMPLTAARVWSAIQSARQNEQK
jgi:carbon-monoxide dehydrogenase large subunit